MFKFGAQLTIGNVVRYLSENMDKVLIGKFTGASAVGLYSKSSQLLMVPMRQIASPILNVAMPALSSLRNQPDRYRRYYERLLGILASITVPLAFYCAVEADFVVQVVLGRQWLAAIPVFRTLAIGALILPAAATRGLVVVSMGRSRRFLCVEAFNAILCVAAFAGGLPFGIEGVARAYTFMIYFILVPSLFYSFRNTPVTITLFLRTVSIPLLISILAAAGAVSVRYAIAGTSIADHVLFLGVFSSIYTAVSWCRRSIRDSVGMFVHALPRLSRS